MEELPLTFLDPWEEFDSRQALSFLRELQVELSPGHPLHGVHLTPIAHSERADDTLFQLADGRVVDVHLTWSSRAEELPYPRCRILPLPGGLGSTGHDPGTRRGLNCSQPIRVASAAPAA